MLGASMLNGLDAKLSLGRPGPVVREGGSGLRLAVVFPLSATFNHARARRKDANSDNSNINNNPNSVP